MNGKLKVGALAERTGITVRTLHHYDEIGLLSPTERTASGHRLYGGAEIERLQRITSLRDLGFPLEEIAACLDRPEYDLDAVLALHMERVRGRVVEAQRLLRTLATIREQVRDGRGADIETLTRSIRMTKMHETYYSPEQLGRLAARADAVGRERMEEVGREWERLFADFARAMETDVDPGSPEVRPLVERHAALVAEFTGGDPGVHSSLNTMFRSEGPDRVMAESGMPGQPAGLWSYIGRAREAHAGGGAAD